MGSTIFGIFSTFWSPVPDRYQFDLVHPHAARQLVALEVDQPTDNGPDAANVLRVKVQLGAVKPLAKLGPDRDFEVGVLTPEVDLDVHALDRQVHDNPDDPHWVLLRGERNIQTPVRFQEKPCVPFLTLMSMLIQG